MLTFLPTGEDIAFSFAVQNPSVAQMARIHHVTINSHGLVVEEDMDGFVLRAGAKPGFSNLEVSETSSVAGEYNEMFVDIGSNFPMVSLSDSAPGFLRLTGFRGYRTPGGFMPILGQQAYQIAKTGYANWTKSDNTDPNSPAVLEMKAGVMMGGCSSVGGEGNCALKVPGVFDFVGLGIQRFSFVLQNTLLLDAGENTLSAQYVSDEVTTDTVSMISPPIGRSLEPPLLEYAQLTENVALRKVRNEITVSLRFNVMLSVASVITITGFHGSPTPSGPLSLSGLRGALFRADFDTDDGIVYLYASVSRSSNVFLDLSEELAPALPALPVMPCVLNCFRALMFAIPTRTTFPSEYRKCECKARRKFPTSATKYQVQLCNAWYTARVQDLFESICMGRVRCIGKLKSKRKAAEHNQSCWRCHELTVPRPTPFA